jgi:hypothetical protein
MAKSRSYSCDEMSMREAEWDISELARDSSHPPMKTEGILPVNHLQHVVVYICKNKSFQFLSYPRTT